MARILVVGAGIVGLSVARSALQAAEMKPSQLTLEVTETVLMNGIDVTDMPIPFGGVDLSVANCRAVSTDILHFSARVVVTPARTLPASSRS